MPDTKNYCLRVKALDGMLRRKDGVTVHEMLQVVNERLEERGVRPVKTKDTILKDMTEISNDFHVRILRVRDEDDSRIIRYRYEKMDFSIYDSGLTEKQIKELRLSLRLLSRCKGFPELRWVRDLCESMDVPLSKSTNPVVEFDAAIGKVGLKNFQGLFFAIIEQRTIEITYDSSDAATVKKMIYPYYLKQSSDKWYLVAALLNTNDNLQLFELDRITSFNFKPEQEYKPVGVSIDDYFKNIFGVHKFPGSKSVTIRFRVPRPFTRQFFYAPIHHSQKVVCQNQDSTIFSIRVIPNGELLQRFLSYGDVVTILTDCDLKDRIIKNLKNCIRNYESST